MLFSKKKEEDDHKDMQNIKDMSNNSQKTKFDNPFAQTSTPNNPANAPTPSFAAQTPQTNVGTNQTNVENQQKTSSFAQPTIQTTTENPISEEKIQELIDETVEKVIDERWEQISANIEKIVKWRDKIEVQISSFKEDISMMREEFEGAQKKINNKISQYDTNILDVNSEIKALEKVFQKITPTLINNVNELQKIAQDLKGVKPNKKEETK